MKNYQFEKLWKVENDAEDDRGHHVSHDAMPRLIGRRHDREVVLHRLRDGQEPFHGQNDGRDHRAHQRDGLKLIEEVDEGDDLKPDSDVTRFFCTPLTQCDQMA